MDLLMVKNLLIPAVIIIFLALDWAALNDILKGNEPNYFAEYGMLSLSLIVFGAIFFFLVRKRT